MAVIFSYPVKSTPELTDKMLISDGTDNLTKQVTVGSLPFSNNAGTVTSVGIAVPAAFEASAAITTSGTITIGVTGGNTGQFLAYDGTWRTPAGGAANAAGADTQVQYNDGGTSFGAGAFFTTNKSSKVDIIYELGLIGDGTSHGLLKIYCEAGTPHYVGIKGPNHTGGTPASYTIQLPNSLPSVANQILESNASGTLSWIATPSGGGGSYSAGDGLDLSGTVFSAGRFTNGGLTISGGKLQVKLNDTDMSGELRAVDGGTGQSVYGVGDLLYAETTTTLGALNVGANDKILGVNNGATAPQWVTNLVGQEVVSGYMLIGAGTSAMTQLDTTAKGTIAVGNSTTTTTLAAGTDAYVLTARSSAATGLAWEAITLPTVNLASGVTGTLPVGNGGTGLASVSASSIPRGNGSSSIIADSYLHLQQYYKIFSYKRHR